MIAVTKITSLGGGKENMQPRVFRYMDILYFQTRMLEGSNIGGVMKSMGINYMCAKQANANDRLANKGSHS